MYVYINEQACQFSKQAMLISGGWWIRRKRVCEVHFVRYLAIIGVFNQIHSRRAHGQLICQTRLNLRGLKFVKILRSVDVFENM